MFEEMPLKLLRTPHIITLLVWEKILMTHFGPNQRWFFIFYFIFFRPHALTSNLYIIISKKKTHNVEHYIRVKIWKTADPLETENLRSYDGIFWKKRPCGSWTKKVYDNERKRHLIKPMFCVFTAYKRAIWWSFLCSVY